jgi:hypothetical protein
MKGRWEDVHTSVSGTVGGMDPRLPDEARLGRARILVVE